MILQEDLNLSKTPDMSTPSGELSTKDKLIQEGIKLFSRHGFEGTTTRMLADAIGANNAVVYFHFKTKEKVVDHYLGNRSHNIFKGC